MAGGRGPRVLSLIVSAWFGIPADERPDLYVFGESLGAYSTDGFRIVIESSRGKQLASRTVGQ